MVGLKRYEMMADIMSQQLLLLFYFFVHKFMANVSICFELMSSDNV